MAGAFRPCWTRKLTAAVRPLDLYFDHFGHNSKIILSKLSTAGAACGVTDVIEAAQMS
jgi:hypothetical protein